MISEIRQQFNRSFTTAKYEAFLNWISTLYNHRPPFKVAETPVFIDESLKKQLFQACEEISDFIVRPDFKELSQGALNKAFIVPNESDHTTFLQMDFGICIQENGELIPQLIEAQGFPSLYYYQDIVAEGYRKFFDIPANFNHLFGGLTRDRYREKLRRAILGDCDPENVILLEIDPHNQATAIDFYATAATLHIAIVGIKDIKREGKQLFYFNETNKKIPIQRIYNRVIFDELVKQDAWQEYEFNLLQEVDVEWAGHPNWFFRISKHTLPYLKSKFVPDSYFFKGS